MVNSCCAVNCTNRVGEKSREKKITFHMFPRKPELRKLWAAALKRYDPITKTQWQPGKHASLCSEHFGPEDFRYNRGYRLLREGAIPTRFNYSTTKLKKLMVRRKKKEVNRAPPEPTPSPVLSSNLDDTVQNKSKDVTKTTNYSQWLLENLYSLRTKDCFCDTVLIVGQQQLKAHSIVLSAGSPFFRAALELYAKPGLRCLTLPGCDFEVLKIAVRFIYTGILEVGKKYARSDQRADLFNSLRKLGINLEHLEGCNIIHNSGADDMVNSRLMTECTKDASVQSRAVKAKSFAAEVCDKEMKLVASQKGECSQNQFSVVNSSFHHEEMKGSEAQDVGCDAALAPAKAYSHNVKKTPGNNTSVLSEVTNGWVLRSKTGLHVVEVPQELLAEIELDSQVNLLDQRSRNASLNSLKNSLHAEDRNVHANDSDAACQDVDSEHKRSSSTKVLPSCSESSVDPVHDDLSIVKEKVVPVKRPNHVCPTCGKAFLGIFRYNVHLRVHTGERPYSCKSCGKTFTVMTNLTRHMQSHTGDRPYLCHLCGLAFIQKSTLEDHVACIHIKEKKHMCTFCGKFFTSLGCYRAHCKRHEGGSVKFRREYSRLSEPMRRMCQEAVPTVSAKGISRFVCKICKKDCASKHILAIHLKRHSIAKPFVCDFCKKSFWQRSHLDVHERLHTGETPFACSTCGKGFRSRGKLSNHEKLHMSEKPYKCFICGSSFSLQSYLKSHMQMHTDDRPYECEACGKKYKKRINLKFHLNRTHASSKTHSS